MRRRLACEEFRQTRRRILGGPREDLPLISEESRRYAPLGSKASFWPRSGHFRSSLVSRPCWCPPACLKGANRRSPHFCSASAPHRKAGRGLIGLCDETDPSLSGDDLGRAVARHLVDAAMPQMTRGPLCTRKIWNDDALGCAARCRRVALSQRRVAGNHNSWPPAPSHAGKPDKRDRTSGPERCRR
jgi:hypothetical protein